MYLGQGHNRNGKASLGFVVRLRLLSHTWVSDHFG
jgi:hypothetical protein